MWIPTKTKKYGVAVYNWRGGGTCRYALPLEIGDTVQVLEECAGWYRGFSLRSRHVRGIFPQAYVHLKPCRVDNEGLYESVVPLEDPVVRELTLVLREWGDIWKRLYVDRESYKFCTLRKVMRDLLDWRRQLLTGTLTSDQTRDLKLKIIAKIDWGNRKLGLDLVPRVGAQMVSGDSMSVVELYHVHVSSAESSQATSARGTLRRHGPPAKVLTHHLYACMRDFGHHIGEDTDIYFSLYDAKKQRYISERFLVRISKEGFSNYVDKLHSNCTIFTDLGNADLTKDIWLVAHVMRMGRMLYDSSRKEKTASAAGGGVFKRPHGAAALNLAELLTTPDCTDEREFTLKVYQGEEKDFHQLHECLIRQQGKYSALSCQPNYGIVLSLRMLHGELAQVRDEHPLLFKNICLTSKLGFADVIMPGDVRNDLYLLLDRGEFERGGKSTGKNIEVTILVLDSERNVLEGCLWGAAGTSGTSHYQSCIIYHHNSPAWAENVRLAVPIDKFAGAHVRLEYRHCSTREKNDKKLFGFSFLRLMDKDGATIQDGTHELYIYKCEDASRLDACTYLSYACCAKDIVPQQGGHESSFTRSHKELVYVRTLLCSTKLTQNVDLLALLRWKAHPERIQESLTRVLRLGDEELVKFLQDVLDALFALFSTEDGNSTAHSGLVFHVLVSIFSLLDESKFQHFKPVLDAYIKGHFAAALVYKGLLTSVQHCAEWVTATDKQEPIQKCFRSLEYIFKLIIQSRVLFARATGGQYEDNFKRDLYSVFSALNNMLAIPSAVILPTQIALLHSISAVYEQLLDVLPTIEVTKIAQAMLDSLHKELPPQLTQAKLIAIKNLVTSKLFHDDESRNLLLATACNHLRYHLAHRDELRLCTDILGEVLSFLFKQRRCADDQGKINNCIHHDVDTLCLKTLDMLIQTVLVIMDRKSGQDSVLGCLVACLVGLLQLLDEFHYSRLWEQLQPSTDRKPLKDFLLRVFLVFRDLVKQEVFPPDWLVIRMVANNVMLKALQELAQPLAFKFLGGGHFDKELWSAYFTLAVAYLTQPSLQLEHFSEVKREKVVERYGDMRVLMGFQLLSLWSQLGPHKLHFIPCMVGPFLEVTLVPEPELRKATLHIFFDMMECEQQARGNFRQVESELIDKLDILVSENKGDDEYRQLFNTILLDRVQSEDPTWKESGAAFISSVTRLLERLLDYRSVLQGDENRDKRMSCTVNLLNFYKNEFNRKEMYLRYIYKLHDLHIQADNYTEAGFTMRLYADQLSWSSSTPIPPDGLPEHRVKERLYHQIIAYFDKGKCWEKGIPLCKELATLYETQLFDYTALSNILKTQARFYDNILLQLRPEPEYFRVGFYGLSFPLFVRNKQFVYRGLEYERIGAFTQRLQTEFPAAQILMKNTPPDLAIVNSDGQYIQICNVKPLPEPNPVILAADIPEKIARFYHYNDVRRFQCDRPVHQPPVDKDNEIKSLWIERTTLQVDSPLPGILRWFEVVHRQTEHIPPVQYACETMQSVQRELRQLVAQYTADPKRNLSPLTMRLQGIIDANVQGGIAKYQQAFFTPEFARLCPPEHHIHVQRLQTLMLEVLHVLDGGLALHGQLAPAGLQPLHQRLVQRITQLRQSLGSCLNSSIVNTPLPPLPTEPHYQQHRPSAQQQHLELFDQDDIYTKPLEILERIGPNNSARDQLSLPMTAPPIPVREGTRPRSQAFTTSPATPTHTPRPRPPSPKPLALRHSLPTPTDPLPNHSHLRNSWSAEQQQAGATDQEAPPLPPRGHTPDKRAPPPPRSTRSNIFSIESMVDISLDEHASQHELRDSGISISDRDLDRQPCLNNFNNLCYEDYEGRTPPQELNISISPPPPPPPIPPKAQASVAAAAGASSADYSSPSVRTHSRQASATTAAAADESCC